MLPILNCLDAFLVFHVVNLFKLPQFSPTIMHTISYKHALLARSNYPATALNLLILSPAKNISMLHEYAEDRFTKWDPVTSGLIFLLLVVKDGRNPGRIAILSYLWLIF